MSRLSSVIVLVLCLPLSVAEAQFVGEDHLTVKLEQFAKVWNELGWNAPADGNRQYLRSLDDDSWKMRMLILQLSAGGDQNVVDQLLEALNSEDDGTRILAAQAIGFTSVAPPTDKLVEHIIRDDELEAVRLYLVDALGMHGVTDVEHLLGDRRPSGRDFRKHLKYARERDGARVERDIVAKLASWNSADAGTAVLDQPAPDFELTDLNGEKIKLSDYRGKKSVVLTFVYGDT